MTARTHDAGWRWLLFVALVMWGLGYIAWFAFLVERSRDYLVAQRARAVCALPATDVTAFSFGSGVMHTETLAAGWGKPEEWGVWSVMKRTRLLLPVPSTMHDGARLQFSVIVPVNERIPEMPVQVSAGGRPLQRWLLSAQNGTPPPLVLPAEMLNGRRCIEIGFAFDNAYRPIKEGVGADARLLGIGLIRVDWQHEAAP